MGLHAAAALRRGKAERHPMKSPKTLWRSASALVAALAVTHCERAPAPRRVAPETRASAESPVVDRPPRVEDGRGGGVGAATTDTLAARPTSAAVARAASAGDTSVLPLDEGGTGRRAGASRGYGHIAPPQPSLAPAPPQAIPVAGFTVPGAPGSAPAPVGVAGAGGGATDDGLAALAIVEDIRHRGRCESALR